MSYDINIAGQSFNYTWNLADLFYKILPHGGLKGLDNMLGQDAAPELLRAMHSLQKLLREHGSTNIQNQYNPENGWGDCLSATTLLSILMGLCYENPSERIYVS